MYGTRGAVNNKTRHNKKESGVSLAGQTSMEHTHVQQYEVVASHLSVHRLARHSGSDGELVWKEEQRTLLGNMECPHVTRQHSWYSHPINLGSARKSMVKI